MRLGRVGAAEEETTRLIEGKPAESVPELNIKRFRKWDLGAFLVHFAQAIALTVLAAIYSSRTFPVANTFNTGRPGTNTTATSNSTLQVMPIAMSAVTEYISAAAHFGMWMFVSDPQWQEYAKRNANPWRWLEYAISSTIVLLQMSVLLGTNNLTTLIGMCGCNVAMICFGDVGDRLPAKKDKKMAFGYGCVAGIVPWIIIFLQLIQAAVAVGSAQIPWFVWSIILSIFLLFSSFAVIEWRKIWYDADFETTEIRYRIASVAAKSSLSWQSFAAIITQ